MLGRSVRAKVHDMLNYLMTNTQFAPKAGDGFTAGDTCANTARLLHRELPSQAAGVPVAPFLDPICDVVLVRPKKQMVRIAAQRGVASVQYVQPVWNRAVCQLPCDAVGSFGDDGVVRNGHLSIPVGPNESRPQPALVFSASGNLRPEAFVEGRAVTRWH